MAASLRSPHQPVLTISASLTQKSSGVRRNSNSITFKSSISSQVFKSPFKSTRSCSRLIPSKPFRVRATILQDEEEKVVVEESFQPKTLKDREEERNKEGSMGGSASSDYERWIIKLEQSINIFLTDSVIKILDTFYRDRHYARFYVLETVARVPYFAFISVLHLYESFGWWRQSDYLKVHFAESWNEMHHLLIMEELGGNAWWFDRFLAQHIAVFYYFMNVVMYAISPRMAYHFSECVENHAYETYEKFLKTQGGEHMCTKTYLIWGHTCPFCEEWGKLIKALYNFSSHLEKLKKLPAPEIAVKYYTGGDLYLFDEFQTSRVPCSRRPKIENLYDVFLNVRDDEAEHCKTMSACQTAGNLRSPHSSLEDNDEAGCVTPQHCEGVVDCLKKSITTSPVESK